MTSLLALLAAANADRLADPDARVTVLLLDPFDLQQARKDWLALVDLDDTHDAVAGGASVVDLVADLDVHRVRGFAEVVAVDGVEPVSEHAQEPTS